MTDAGPPPFAAAMDALERLTRASEVVSVLRSAQESGLLSQLLQPCLPTLPGVAAERVDVVLGLLSAYGVVCRAGDAWQLTDAWRPVVAGETPLDLEAVLGLSRVRTEQVGKALTAGEDYWQLSPADRLLVARGMSFDPSSSMAVAMARDSLAALPEVVAALEGGGRVLELGCGVGSRMTALLQAFPLATGVGVELAADLVEAGRARAARLGVGDRLTYVCGDATTYEPDGLFDTVQWSQFFFPRPARAGALATAHRALRPGGWINMPVVWDGEPLEPGSVAEQEIAAERLVLDLWGVPLRSTHEMRSEVEAAGFTDVRVDLGPVVHFVRGRRG